MQTTVSAARRWARSAASGSGPGSTVSTSLRAASGRAARAAQAVTEVTPGVTSTR